MALRRTAAQLGGVATPTQIGGQHPRVSVVCVVEISFTLRLQATEEKKKTRCASHATSSREPFGAVVPTGTAVGTAPRVAYAAQGWPGKLCGRRAGHRHAGWSPVCAGKVASPPSWGSTPRSRLSTGSSPEPVGGTWWPATTRQGRLSAPTRRQSRSGAPPQSLYASGGRSSTARSGSWRLGWTGVGRAAAQFPGHQGLTVLRHLPAQPGAPGAAGASAHATACASAQPGRRGAADPVDDVCGHATHDPPLPRWLYPQAGLRADSGEGGAPISLGQDESDGSFEPFDVDFKTVGEFYHKIVTGFPDDPGTPPLHRAARSTGERAFSRPGGQAHHGGRPRLGLR